MKCDKCGTEDCYEMPYIRGKRVCFRCFHKIKRDNHMRHKTGWKIPKSLKTVEEVGGDY